MLKLASDTDALLARLAAVPAAVQAAVTPAVSAAARAYAPAQTKQEALRVRMTHERARRVHPDREKALARVSHPASTAKAGSQVHDHRKASRPAPSRGMRDEDLAKLKQAAIQGALKALGRT